MPLDRNADPAAMAARIKELEAQLAAQPSAPQTPVAAILAVSSSIMGLIPKWLIAAGLAVFIAFHAFSYYQQAQQQAADTALKQAEQTRATYDPDEGTDMRRRAAARAKQLGLDIK